MHLCIRTTCLQRPPSLDPFSGCCRHVNCISCTVHVVYVTHVCSTRYHVLRHPLTCVLPSVMVCISCTVHHHQHVPPCYLIPILTSTTPYTVTCPVVCVCVQNDTDSLWLDRCELIVLSRAVWWNLSSTVEVERYGGT